MDKKFHRLYLHEIAFNLIPQQLFCTKATKDHGVKVKENYFEMSMPLCRMYCTIWFTSRSTNYITSNLIGLNMDLTCLKA